VTRKVRGEQPLPGRPEALLQAAALRRVHERGRWDDYLSISVTRRGDGTLHVMLTRMDETTHRVLPVNLDIVPGDGTPPMALEEVVLYWAQEVALRGAGGWG
jgi:hypothetical protein